MIAVIAAYTNRTVTDEDVETFRTAHPDALDGDDDDDFIPRHLLDEGCAEGYRIMFGQRSRREDWNNVQDPTAPPR